jgi:hypothetical protein
MTGFSKGFSLSEALVALALVAGLMVSVLDLLGTFTAESMASLRRAQAHHLLMASLARLSPSPPRSPGQQPAGLQEASALVVSSMPGANLTYNPACPRWPGNACLVITWGQGAAAPCLQQTIEGHEWTAVQCLSVAL